MQDQPTPSEVIGAVAAFLKTVVAAQTTGATSFQARVAANALEMMRRQLDLAPAEDAAELARLKALLGTDGSLADLNVELARRIEAGELDLTTPGLSDHLWATTMAKLAVDQPTYAAYRAALAERDAKPSPELFQSAVFPPAPSDGPLFAATQTGVFRREIHEGNPGGCGDQVELDLVGRDVSLWNCRYRRGQRRRGARAGPDGDRPPANADNRRRRQFEQQRFGLRERQSPGRSLRGAPRNGATPRAMVLDQCTQVLGVTTLSDHDKAATYVDRGAIYLQHRKFGTSDPRQMRGENGSRLRQRHSTGAAR